MRISDAFAYRKDLTISQKWRYTLEEKITEAFVSRVRVAYRRYVMLPQGVRATLDIFVTFPGLLCFIVVLGPVEAFGQWLFRGDVPDWYEKSALAFFAVGLIALGFLHPLLWVPLGAVLMFVAALLIWSAMDDFECELRRELSSR